MMIMMMLMTACSQIWITVQAKGKDCIIDIWNNHAGKWGELMSPAMLLKMGKHAVHFQMVGDDGILSPGQTDWLVVSSGC